MGSLNVDAAGLAGLKPPFFIRKLNKRSDWGDPSDPLEDRVDEAIDKAFRSDEDTFSFYRVRNDAELAVVVVALNAHRARLSSTLDFIAVTGGEFKIASISILEEPGETSCDFANFLHVDVKPSTAGSIRELCELAMRRDRPSARISRTQAKDFVKWARSCDCRAVNDGAECDICRSGDMSQPLACSR